MEFEHLRGDIRRTPLVSRDQQYGCTARALGTLLYSLHLPYLQGMNAFFAVLYFALSELEAFHVGRALLLGPARCYYRKRDIARYKQCRDALAVTIGCLKAFDREFHAEVEKQLQMKGIGLEDCLDHDLNAAESTRYDPPGLLLVWDVIMVHAPLFILPVCVAARVLLDK
eukprot:CAMPEP_0119154376 /NCGR_PEP_ID=MMETSP1310-20130426/50718_1 /TAXON_ID=464262 /ORGANISM="Genus nov. species nov., Strain RCC2339" /LENGTH=169 /DNA_ID=CAMNT_0007146903 /DNA_START=90 /DNA_END=596 /DNA_ORIENTATION=-